MRFVNVGGGAARWRWFRMPGSDLELELYCPEVTEIERMAKRSNDEVERMQRWIAKHWFRDFKNALDAGGEPLENTEEIRAAMLQAFDVWKWVNETVLRTSEWREEGKGDSVSG